MKKIIKLIKQIYYIGGTVYRGSIGILHNLFDKPKLNKSLKSFSIGKTELGREILAYKFLGNGQGKLLIVGGVHGNEVGTVKLTTKILNYLNLNQEKNGWAKIFIIPCLNLDGYAQARKHPDYMHRGKVGRLNANKVDLNRDFIEKSASETKALINFIKQENIKNIIALHSVESKVYVSLQRKNDIENKWAETYKKFAKFKTGSDSNQKGSMGPWARENNLNYITVESSTRWGSDWRRQKNALKKIIENN